MEYRLEYHSLSMDACGHPGGLKPVFLCFFHFQYLRTSVTLVNFFPESINIFIPKVVLAIFDTKVNHGFPTFDMPKQESHFAIQKKRSRLSICLKLLGFRSRADPSALLPRGWGNSSWTQFFWVEKWLAIQMI